MTKRLMMEKLTTYQIWQLEKYGNIVPGGNTAELENGLLDANAAEKWSEQQAENQLFENQ